jgi:outer membrane protein TolC
VLPDLRLGAGYNFTAIKEPFAASGLPTRRGFYFTITSKFSNLFNLFGTRKADTSQADASSEVTK